jgi:pyruvate formate lyase activating enzyme
MYRIGKEEIDAVAAVIEDGRLFKINTGLRETEHAEEEMREMTEWIAELSGSRGNSSGAEIPLHISRFFPQFHMTDRKATDVSLVYRLADVARERLRYVYTGNC